MTNLALCKDYYYEEISDQNEIQKSIENFEIVTPDTGDFGHLLGSMALNWLMK